MDYFEAHETLEIAGRLRKQGCTEEAKRLREMALSAIAYEAAMMYFDWVNYPERVHVSDVRRMGRHVVATADYRGDDDIPIMTELHGWC